MGDIVKEGDYVVLRDVAGALQVVQVTKPTANINKKGIRLGNHQIPLKLLLKARYYETYRYLENKWILIDSQTLAKEQFSTATAEENVDADGQEDHEEQAPPQETSNESRQCLSDTNTAQKMSCDEVVALKKGGINPDALIHRLVTNSATFQQRTDFSKMKYLQKKRKKHISQFTIVPTSLMSLSEAYLAKEPRRIGGLRYDYLNTMMSVADVTPGSRVLVFDFSAGLLTAGVLQRLQGCGCVFRAGGDILPQKLIKELNLDASLCSIIHELPLSLVSQELLLRFYLIPTPKSFLNQQSIRYYIRLFNWQSVRHHTFEHTVLLQLPLLLQNPVDAFNDPESDLNKHIWIKPPKDLLTAPEMADRKKAKTSLESSVAKSRGDGPLESDPVGEDMEARRQEQLAYLKRQRTRAAMLRLLKLHGVDVILACCPASNPGIKGGIDLATVKDLFTASCEDLLVPDGRFAIFSLSHSVALAAQLELIQKPQFVAMRFQELFLREHQVLPQRTHPLMGSGKRLFCGFLFSGSVIDSPPDGSPDTPFLDEQEGCGEDKSD